MTAGLSINARHRRHYKSGGCLDNVHAATVAKKETSRKFMRFFRDVLDEARRKIRLDEKAESPTAILTRPEYFERASNPRTTQSMFGRAMSKVLGFFRSGKKAA
jgi:hypothetical protein